jgi:hypothetical protein
MAAEANQGLLEALYSTPRISLHRCQVSTDFLCYDVGTELQVGHLMIVPEKLGHPDHARYAYFTSIFIILLNSFVHDMSF